MKSIKMNKAVGAALCGLVALAAAPAHATLTLLSAEDFQGTGLGTVNTVLTLQSNTSFESGSVVVGANNMQSITGDAKTGTSQTMLRSLGSLGVSSAADLRVVFNAVEPSPNSSITLADLVLSIYDANGAVLFSSSPFTPVTLDTTLTGIGNSGFVFGLDATQAAAAQSAVFAGGQFGAYRVGLSASLGDANGGPETFFVASAQGGPVMSPVPEPETYAMLFAGLGVLGFMNARRNGRGRDRG